MSDGNNIKINSGTVTFVDDDAPEQECEFNVKLKGRGTMTIPGVGGGAATLPDLSFDEQYAGYHHWDGRKVYCKTIQFGQLPSNAASSKPHGIPNIDWVLKREYIAHRPAPNVLFENENYYIDTTGSIYVSAQQDTISTRTHGNWSGIELFVTVYYTCKDR